MGKLDEFVAGGSGTAMTAEVHEAINRIIRRHEDEILSWNTQKQLYDDGIDGKGDIIIPPYAESTIKKKLRKKQVTDRVTLKDTGDFYRAFMIIYANDHIQITSNPQIKRRDFMLSSWLKSRYGKDIFGLTPQHVARLKEIVQTELPIELKRNG